MKFVPYAECKTKAELNQRMGFDWAKIVRVDGGWMLFDTIQAWKTWRNQK